MKNALRISTRFVLAAGTLATLTALPTVASAQMVGGFTRPGFSRPGAVVQGQSAPPMQAGPQIQAGQQMQFRQQMRSGPIQRGGLPIYRPAPIQNTGTVYGAGGGSVYGAGSLYGGGQNYQRGPVVVQQPVYGRGGTTYYNNGSGYSNGDGGGWQRGDGYGNGGYSGTGPVVTVPDNNYPTGVATYPGNSTYGRPYLPPVGPGNGYFTNPIPPVGPANGFFSGQAPITGGGPALLGGYYYGNYCDNGGYRHEYRSLYSGYSGFPQYIYSTNVIVSDVPQMDYAAPAQAFYAPVYQTTYNQNNYYVATPERVEQLQEGGAPAKAALEHAYPADSFQAAFADIAHAWTDGNIDLVRKHLRNPDTRISVFLDGKYSYSIASSDFSQITRDALDRLHTASFDFTRLRKLKNGDVTAFGTHVYRAADAAGSTDEGNTVPFDQTGNDSSADGATLGASKTVYVSYTLRRYGAEWDVVATDSASHDLAASGAKSSG